MGELIYGRFDILGPKGPRGTCRARDQALDREIELHWWEPAGEDFEDACRRLQHCADAFDRNSSVEVFSDGRLLYLAAPSTEGASAALATRREAGLFTDAQPAPPADVPSAPAHSLALADEYHRVRSSSDRDRDVDAFQAKYGSIRISCVNFRDLRSPSAILRFRASPLGGFFMVAQGSQILAFPWFTSDLNHERDWLEGIFQYPSGGGVARVARPAILEQRNTGFVMVAQGLLEAGAPLPAPIQDPVPPPAQPKRKGRSRVLIGCLVTMGFFCIVFLAVVIKSCS